MWAPALLLALAGLVGAPAGGARAAGPSSPTPAPATNVQIDWEHCLLSVLHRYKKAGPEPTSPLDQTCVGMRLVRGYDGPKNPAAATPYFRRAAEAGNATAMVMLANALLKGHGVPPDVPQALRLMRQAVDRGQTDAMLSLGEFAFRGSHGVPQDRRLARERVQAAAERGNRAAWIALQQVFGPEAPLLDKAVALYQAGRAAQAWPLFQQAARAGNVRAQFQLGWQLDKGEGVGADAAAAAGWYRKAADQGDGEAAAALGRLLEDGRGLAENWIDAAQWYRRSAERGDPMGTFFYGRAWQCGIGVPQNRNDAIEWFWRAEARGHPEGGRWGAMAARRRQRHRRVQPARTGRHGHAQHRARRTPLSQRGRAPGLAEPEARRLREGRRLDRLGSAATRIRPLRWRTRLHRARRRAAATLTEDRRAGRHAAHIGAKHPAVRASAPPPPCHHGVPGRPFAGPWRPRWRNPNVTPRRRRSPRPTHRCRSCRWACWPAFTA